MERLRSAGPETDAVFVALIIDHHDAGVEMAEVAMADADDADVRGLARRIARTQTLADVTRGNLRVLLSGPESSAGRTMTDGERPVPGGWNRIHLSTADIDGEIARLRSAGVPFRNDVVSGPGGQQVLVQDPSGNLVELFQPR